MLLNILLTLHILICIALIGVILLQRSEGGAFGVGGGGNSFMTARGAGDLLTRTTAILAGLFFLLSLVLTLLSGRGAGSVTDNLDINAVAPRSAPATAPLQAPAPTTDNLLPTAPAPTDPMAGLSAPAPEPAPPANR
jgi:preprotein translocase subunit SecG